MKTTILFPADYFDLTKIDEQFEPEYKEAAKLPEFGIAFYNHDALIEGEKLKIHPGIEPGDCIARTWMLKPEEYTRLYYCLQQEGVRMINDPEEYSLMHLFPNIYPSISESTPRILVFENPDNVDTDLANCTFSRFMIKDSVKSAKDDGFPACIETPINDRELDSYIKRFVELRGELFTGGIVLKEYVDLKWYGSTSNEYRVFYLLGQILSISRNSNQPGSTPFLPVEIAEKFSNLKSNYYTVDFGETESGEFLVLETGDGQASGLSPFQNIFKYYDDMRYIIESRE